MHRQPGCWLRSSHSFKECVIAHWSSGHAPKMYRGSNVTPKRGIRRCEHSFLEYIPPKAADVRRGRENVTDAKQKVMFTTVSGRGALYQG